LSHVRAVDGIFQVVRAFDDTEVTHVEGDVDPIRDMEIIQTELRLKDIEWVEKAIDNMKKTTRSLNSTSLADKAKKEELVRAVLILNLRAGRDWVFSRLPSRRFIKFLRLTKRMFEKQTGRTKRCVQEFLVFTHDEKEHCSITQLVETGVTPQNSMKYINPC
jgi:obg-like ATPase 1